VDERLKRLIAKRELAAKNREQLLAQRKAIVDLAEQEAREDLSTEEDTEFRTLTSKVAEADAELSGVDERISELSAEAERERKVSEGAAALRRAQARAQVNSEALTYRKDNLRTSYFADLAKVQLNMDDNGESRARLQRHGEEVRSAPEYRDLARTDGNGGYFVPPAWLLSDFAPLARAARPTANLVHSEALPSGTDSINIPTIATGTATAIQTADNAAVQEVDLTDATINAGVKTIAGQQDVAIQLLDQSPVAFDQIIFQDLMADYATKVDLQVISGSNASGQVKGIRGASGTNAVTYTDGTPTVAELFPKIADAIQQIHTGRFLPPSVIVMHPRRWAWFTAALDTTGRPLVAVGAGAQNSVATFDGVVSQQVVGSLQGLPVVTDPNIPINLGAGTNEDIILVMRASDLLLWESSIRSRVLPEVGSGTLTVRLQVYGYIAFSAERYPKSTSILGGTGLVTPAF
jgi:HK97 family phage major capsid protein